MKKIIPFLIPALLFCMNCSCSEGKGDNEEQEHIDPPDIDVDTNVHATTITADPTTPFYLKVGETKTVKVTLSESPTLSEEHKFTWTNKSAARVQLTDYSSSKKKEDWKKADLTGLKEGQATVVATNNYMPSLTKSFTANVINFSEKNNYLWQYKTEDRAQFGYDSKTNKLGNSKGVAVLGGKEWSYTRSSCESLQSANGAVGFGKGSAPEQIVHLESENSRIIDKIVIEAASHKNLGKMTLKVGSTTVFDEKTMPDITNGNVVSMMSSDGNLGLEGDISIDMETPAFEPAKAEDPNYIKPGAIYLKSILLYYRDEEVKSIELDPSCTLKTDYMVGDQLDTTGLLLNEVTERGTRYPIDLELAEEEGRFSASHVTFDTAKHEAQKVTLHYTVKETGQVLDYEYYVHVRDESWEPEKIEVVGDLSEAEYEAGDEVFYDDLKIKVVYDTATDDVMYYPFEDFGRFEFTYGDEEDPFVALEAMKNGYTIHIVGNFKLNSEDPKDIFKLSTNYVVPAGKLTVAPAIFDRIDFRKSYVLDKLNFNDKASYVEYEPKDGHGIIKFEGLKKDNNKKPATSKPFNFVVKDTNYVVDRVNLQMALSTTKTNAFQMQTSVFGGDIYGDPVATLTNNKIVYTATTDNINCLRFIPGKTSTGSDSTTGMRIISILVRYKEGTHVPYTLDKGETAPTKTTYTEGELFDPTGLQFMLKSDYNNTNIDVTNCFEWYDGSTYEKEPQKTLLPESTYVVGVFHEKTIQIPIEKVNAAAVNLTLVKDISEITDEGHYYLVNAEAGLVNLGSAKSLNSGSGSAEPGAVCLEGVKFEDTATINILYANDYFNILKEEGKDTFVINGTNGHGWSVSAGGNTSSTLAPKDGFRSFSISIDPDTGIATIHMQGTTGNGTAVNKYLGCTDAKFDLYDAGASKLEEKLCVSIYKAI